MERKWGDVLHVTFLLTAALHMLTRAADVVLKPLMFSWRSTLASTGGRQQGEAFNWDQLSWFILPPLKPKGPLTLKVLEPYQHPTGSFMFVPHPPTKFDPRGFCVTFPKITYFLCCFPSLQDRRITVILTATLQMKTVLLMSCLVGTWTSDSPLHCWFCTEHVHGSKQVIKYYTCFFSIILVTGR